MKTFSDKQNLTVFISSKPKLQKPFKKVLQAERIRYQTNLDVHKETKISKNR